MVSSEFLEVAIIGAGFSGIAMARALQGAGVENYRVFEKAAAAGGTWRDNTYPGAACDVPSHLYSLSDAPKTDWSRLFPRQPEIQSYLESLAQPLRASGQLQTGFRMTRAVWDEASALWQIESDSGRRIPARTLVLAMGGLHQPAWPDIPGRDDFAGDSFHTARWRHDADLAGKRVAVIGTGASAIQVVPEIVRTVAQLHLFQRTPPWVLPRPDAAIPRWLQWMFQRIPGARLALRGAIFLWLELLSTGLLHPRTAFWARALGRRNLRRQITDPQLRERLRPDYPIGCKRVMLSSDYYPAVAQDNCSLVTQDIARIEARGIRLQDGSLVEVDSIIYATGFRPLDVLNAVEIEGRAGHRLSEDWRERPQAHLGISVHGYPNLHFLLGPNTALGHNSVLTMIESQAQHVLAAIAARKARSARWIEATAEAQAGFVAELDQRFVGTAWAGGCHSWYLDAQGRNIALWIGSVMGYRRRVRSISSSDFRFG